MVYQPKTSRREHPPETIAVVWKLHQLNYSASKIAFETGVPKSTVTYLIRRAILNNGHVQAKIPRPGRPPKLNPRVERRLIRYLSAYPFDTLACLSTPSKSG